MYVFMYVSLFVLAAWAVTAMLLHMFRFQGPGGGGKDSSVTQDCILGKVHVFQGVGRHHVGEGLITKTGNAIITIASKTDVQKALRGVGI